MAKARSKLLFNVLEIITYRRAKFKADTKAPLKKPKAERFCFKKTNTPKVTNVITILIDNIFIISRFIAFNPINGIFISLFIFSSNLLKYS